MVLVFDIFEHVVGFAFCPTLSIDPHVWGILKPDKTCPGVRTLEDQDK